MKIFTNYVEKVKDSECEEESESIRVQDRQ